MAKRSRIKIGGILEYSTNPARNTLAKRLLIEVRCKGMLGLSYAYDIIGIRKEESWKIS